MTHLKLTPAKALQLLVAVCGGSPVSWMAAHEILEKRLLNHALTASPLLRSL